MCSRHRCMCNPDQSMSPRPSAMSVMTKANVLTCHTGNTTAISAITSAKVSPTVMSQLARAISGNHHTATAPTETLTATAFPIGLTTRRAILTVGRSLVLWGGEWWLLEAVQLETGCTYVSEICLLHAMNWHHLIDSRLRSSDL